MKKVIKKKSAARQPRSTKRVVVVPAVPVVDEIALVLIRKIEKRVREFREHVGADSKTDNIRYTHATRLLEIVRMMRNAELDGWTDI